MNIRIDPLNRALFEFEDAMFALEAAYDKLRAEFDMGSYHYLKMKRRDTPEYRLEQLRAKLATTHVGLQRCWRNLQHVYSEHRELTTMVEYRLLERENSGGSP